MARKKSPKSMYIVKAAGRNYTYGAFPYTEEGKKRRKSLLRKSVKKGRKS